MKTKSKADLPQVLVIDDDPELPSIIEAALHGRAKIVPCHNWTNAEKLLDKDRYYLILLDLFLPDTDPLTPLRCIREIDLDYPIVIMSGNIDESSPLFDHIMRLGVNSILSKPFDLQRLEKEVSMHIGDIT
ncbi:MAG: response regulator [Planctomycetes bacterium]|nr:response regulator [Planctomycetota bacterium]